MTFDMSSDDESDSQPMAPVLYLQDKTSNFADGIEDDNWEEQAANKLTDAMQGTDERSEDIIRARWLDEDNKSTLQELADRYGVSAERVRQLEKNAMKNCVPRSKPDTPPCLTPGIPITPRLRLGRFVSAPSMGSSTSGQCVRRQPISTLNAGAICSSGWLANPINNPFLRAAVR